MGGTRAIDRRGRETREIRRVPRGTRRIMLASTGGPIEEAVIDRTAELVSELGEDRPTQVVVIAVARIWGTSLGLPNPGLYPNKHEWDDVRSIVELAAAKLRRHGIDAKTKVV